MNKLIITILLISCAFSSGGDADVIKVFEIKHIDINAKSYLGWARVLNNQEKRIEYKLNDLDKDEITLYIYQLKELSAKEATGGKLR